MYNGTKYSLTRAGFDAKPVLTEHVYRFFGAYETTTNIKRTFVEGEHAMQLPLVQSPEASLKSQCGLYEGKLPEVLLCKGESDVADAANEYGSHDLSGLRPERGSGLRHV